MPAPKRAGMPIQFHSIPPSTPYMTQQSGIMETPWSIPWFQIVCGLVLIIFLFFFPLETGPNKFLWNPVFDAGHFGLFFLITLGIYYYLVRQRGIRGIVLTVLFSFLLAAIVEIAQPYFGRSASTTDLKNGTIGLAVAALWLLPIMSSGRKRAYLIGAAILFQLLLLAPSRHALSAIRWRTDHFPVLASFENTDELLLWRPTTEAVLSIVPEHATEGQHSLRIALAGQAWSGVEYFAGLADWSAHTMLVLDIINPNDSVYFLGMRIDDDENCDTYERRFNHRFDIRPGVNTLRIPITAIRNGPRTRQMHMDKIKRVLLFNTGTENVIVLNLDSMRLE